LVLMSRWSAASARAVERHRQLPHSRHRSPLCPDCAHTQPIAARRATPTTCPSSRPRSANGSTASAA